MNKETNHLIIKIIWILFWIVWIMVVRFLSPKQLIRKEWAVIEVKLFSTAVWYDWPGYFSHFNMTNRSQKTKAFDTLT